MLIDEMETGDILTLAIDEYTVYDENNNGNMEVSNVPVIITSSNIVGRQPPKIVPSGIVYDANTDVLTLPWNMDMKYFNVDTIPPVLFGDVGDTSWSDVIGDTIVGEDYYSNVSSVSDFSELKGIALYDSIEDSLITFNRGKVYQPKPFIIPVLSGYDTTYIKLSEADAGLLESYPNRSNLILIVEPYRFYSVTYNLNDEFNNGNKAVTEDSLFVVDYHQDETAPEVDEVLFNEIDSTLAITLDGLVKVDVLDLEKLTFGGIAIDGEIVVDSAAQYVSNFSVKVSSLTYDNIVSLDDSVKVSPLFQAFGSTFVNADGTSADWINHEAHYGYKFWIQGFEAFPSPPYLIFASLRASGINCDIYVDLQAWETKIDSADIAAIVTAFDETAPNDASQGISGLAQDFLDASIDDTDIDGNGKVIFVFTDLLDEYKRGRSDTKSTLFVHGYSTALDTLDGEPYSNHGDIIYLDVNPMSLNSSDDDLVATYNAISHEYTRMIMQHNQPDQEPWIIEGVSAVLQKKIVGDVKFFGKSTSPSITDGNQLTYIATSPSTYLPEGYQSLKNRKDKWNTYLFLSYLQEKYSAGGTEKDIIEEIARSDSIGIKAVSDALDSLYIDIDVKDIFADYGMACFLDAVQADSLYDGRYSFEGIDLQTPPAAKNPASLKWDVSIGKGAPYTQKDILPWSYSYVLTQGYSFDLAGNVNDISPNLKAEDSLVFNGYDGIRFKVKKLMLKSGFSSLMNPEYEVTDFELDDQTSYGTLPVTTDPLFAFRDTLDNAQNGVQLMLLMIAKTDEAQPSTTYDFSLSNIVDVPDLSDLYIYQSPGIQNYLDVYVVSLRRVFDRFGHEGPTVEYAVTTGDSGSVALTELSSYGSDVDSSFIVIYHTSNELDTEGEYTFTYQGSDQSGTLFETDSLTIVVDYYDPVSSSRIVVGNAEYNLPRASLDSPLMIAAGSTPVHRSVSFPEGFVPVGEIIMFGPNDQKLNRSATVIFSLKETDQAMSIYQFHKGEWRHIGAEIIGNSLQASTNSLGQFIVLSGLHGELDKDLVLPKQYALYQNYPNPFNPVTNMAFDLPEPGYVTLVVYDIMGREIARIFDGDLSGGYYKFKWDGKHSSGHVVSTGIYFYRFTAGNFHQTRKMLIIK